MRTFDDKKNGILFDFDPKTETVHTVSYRDGGHETTEAVDRGTVEKLIIQIGEPMTRVLLKGSKNLAKPAKIPPPLTCLSGCDPSTDCWGCWCSDIN
jgi:hypothetical protein